MTSTPATAGRGPADLEGVLTVLLLGAMAAITVVEIAARFIFHAPLAHVSELVPNLFVWLTFIGASAAERSGTHFGIDLVSKNRPLWARASAAARLVGTGFFFMVVAAYGARMCLLSYTKGETTALGIPAWCFALAVPVGAVLFVRRLIGPVLRRDH